VPYLKKSSVICLILITTALIASLNIAFAQATTSPTTTPQTTINQQSVSTNGNSWINPNGKHDSFSFFANKGTLRADGWHYNPTAQVSFTGKDFKNSQGNQVNIQVWSTKVWRFKIDNIANGEKAIIAGITSVKIGQQDVKNNWWFRITAKDMADNKDTFMIQLWRPIGSNNLGGWSAGDFKLDKPATLSLNSQPAYQVQGILKGGDIIIKP
jgi:hypothetical protein